MYWFEKFRTPLSCMNLDTEPFILIQFAWKIRFRGEQTLEPCVCHNEPYWSLTRNTDHIIHFERHTMRLEQKRDFITRRTHVSQLCCTMAETLARKTAQLAT